MVNDLESLGFADALAQVEELSVIPFFSSEFVDTFLEIEVNGEQTRVNRVASVNISDLLHDLGYVDVRGIAVAVNDAVVPRNSWQNKVVVSGEKVLIVTPAQGG